MAAIIVMTKFYHVWNLQAMQHFKRSTTVCNRANIFIPESSKWRFNSNETLSKTSESVEISYWLKSCFRLIRATPHFSSVKFYDKIRPFGMDFCFKCPALIFAWFESAKFLVEIILAVGKLWHTDSFHHYTILMFFSWMFHLKVVVN